MKRREFTCEVCGAIFTRDYPVPGPIILKYCSKECRSKGQSRPRQVRTCVHCGRAFSPEYRTSKILQFCSKRCKATYQRTISRNWTNREELVARIKDEIPSAGRYLTADEVRARLRVTTRTLTRLKISILEIHQELGIMSPHRVFESLVGSTLEELYPDIKHEQTFDGCVSPKGYPLRFDFYSKAAGLLVEADGDQHIDENHLYSSEYYRLCDEIKMRWAKSSNILLVRIPYTKRVTRKYVLKHLARYGVTELSTRQHDS